MRLLGLTAVLWLAALTGQAAATPPGVNGLVAFERTELDPETRETVERGIWGIRFDGSG